MSLHKLKVHDSLEITVRTWDSNFEKCQRQELDDKSSETTPRPVKILINH